MLNIYISMWNKIIYCCLPRCCYIFWNLKFFKVLNFIIVIRKKIKNNNNNNNNNNNDNNKKRIVIEWWGWLGFFFIVKFVF